MLTTLLALAVLFVPSVYLGGTLVEAKDALRAAAQSAEEGILAPMDPHRAMLLALLAGILVGTSPDARKRLARVLVELIFLDRRA